MVFYRMIGGMVLKYFKLRALRPENCYGGRRPKADVLFAQSVDMFNSDVNLRCVGSPRFPRHHPETVAAIDSNSVGLM
jgi:hypothetical protein